MLLALSCKKKEQLDNFEFIGEVRELKKKLLLVILLLIVLCGLIPQKQFLEDGGSVEYKAVLYSVTDVKEIGGDGIDDKYQEGIRVKILGIKVFDNVK